MLSQSSNAQISTKWNCLFEFVVPVPLTFTYFALIVSNVNVVPLYPGFEPVCSPTFTHSSLSSLTNTS